MNRASVISVIVLSSCSQEVGISEGAPVWPSSVAPPLPERTQTDTILQVTTPRVDILWMIDNSCSMSDNQRQLTDNVPSFMQFFIGSGLDYHVGVTSSDIISSDYPGSSGTLVVKNGSKYVEPDSPDPLGLFISMASLGTTGRFPERGLGATYLALEVKRDTTNDGFYRDEAALHTIIISDEPDYTQDSTITQPEFVDWYDGLKPRDQRTFSSIIDPGRGSRYSNTAEQIGGIVWSLNEGGWAQVLEQLGLQAAGLQQEYFLSHVPVPGTITVKVEEVASSAEFAFTEAVLDPTTGEFVGDWTYSATRNSITFLDYIPGALAEVTIQYTLAAAIDLD
jgi:hypothetical protein